MAINNQLADMEYKLNQIVAGLSEIGVEIKDANNKLRYDIEPKLDKALEGKDTFGGSLPTDKALRVMRDVFYHTLYGNKITAIKACRELTGASLKEAKDAIERMERTYKDFADQHEKETF